MLSLCDTAGILAFENSLYAARKFHIDFADNLLVFNYVYADAGIDKTKYRIINIDDVINFNDILFSRLFRRNILNQA